MDDHKIIVEQNTRRWEFNSLSAKSNMSIIEINY